MCYLTPQRSSRFYRQGLETARLQPRRRYHRRGRRGRADHVDAAFDLLEHAVRLGNIEANPLKGVRYQPRRASPSNASSKVNSPTCPPARENAPEGAVRDHGCLKRK
jgi:hypothetical protein